MAKANAELKVRQLKKNRLAESMLAPLETEGFRWFFHDTPFLSEIAEGNNFAEHLTALARVGYTRDPN